VVAQLNVCVHFKAAYMLDAALFGKIYIVASDSLCWVCIVYNYTLAFGQGGCHGFKALVLSGKSVTVDVHVVKGQQVTFSECGLSASWRAYKQNHFLLLQKQIVANKNCQFGLLMILDYLIYPLSVKLKRELII